jgi:hypothetical protein
LSTREIEADLAEMYGVKVGRDLISRVTDAVMDDVREWQQRPLDDVHPVLFLDALMQKIREGGTVQRKACYLASEVTLEGDRDVLGMLAASGRAGREIRELGALDSGMREVVQREQARLAIRKHPAAARRNVRSVASRRAKRAQRCVCKAWATSRWVASGVSAKPTTSTQPGSRPESRPASRCAPRRSGWPRAIRRMGTPRIRPPSVSSLERRLCSRARTVGEEMTRPMTVSGISSP